MQAEKYLFHLSKWGVAGEKNITERQAPHLPKGLSVRITNPKAIIIAGACRRSNCSISSSLSGNTPTLSTS
jgi:hypothetical protein